MAGSALLILEGPWWTPEEKPKRPSVLPFFEGMENYKGDFNIYYSNFYERRGFRRALLDDLTNTNEDRLYLYVTAHGWTDTIGGLKSGSGMSLSRLFKELKDVANYSNIEGILLGSCNIGCNINDFLRTTRESNVVWIFGYTCEIEWMATTFIDVSIFEQLINIPKPDLRKRKNLVSAFSAALKMFDGNYPICGGEGIHLKDAISLVVSPRGIRKPKDCRRDLIRQLGWAGNNLPQISPDTYENHV
jgi:hypothetical protein